MPDFFAPNRDAYFPMSIPGYQMLDLLGQGASGQVYKARQISTGQFVAIKLAIDSFSNCRAQQRAMQECRVLAMLSHPHVVRLIDQGSGSGGQNFMVLEYLSGTTLRNFLRRHGALTLADSTALMAQLLDALAYLQQHRIVHRDLKPENIMVTASGCALHLKILDFGIAGDHRESLLTHAAGTPAYCAPEQLRGEPCGPATDIYAWALIFLECLSANACVQGSTATEVIAQQLNTCVVLPEGVAGLPLASLLQRALQKDPRLRSADAAALYDELTNLSANLRTAPRVQSVFSNLAKRGRCGSNAETKQSTLEHFPAVAAVAESPGEHSILCLRLLLVPANDASVCLKLLKEIQQEQHLWCVNTVHSGYGECLGVLGECTVFHFVHAACGVRNLPQDAKATENLVLAATAVLDLSTRLRRRSRLLEVQHGVRIIFSAALHQHRASGDGSSLNHAINRALQLASWASSDAILTNELAQHRLAHCLRFAPWTPNEQGDAKALVFELLGTAV